MTLSNVSFDEQPRGSGASRGLKAITEALEDQSFDASTELFDEALRLAGEGHLGQARDRLRMLLTLDPADGDAHLLLAKVYLTQGRFPEALSEIDATVSCGTPVPAGLREACEAGRDTDRRADHGEKVAARAQTELRALREETRRLRSENAVLEQDNGELAKRVRRWSWTTTIVASVCTVLVATTAFTRGGGEEPADTLTAEALSAPPLVEAPALPPVPHARTYTVQPGDNLSGISKKVYGQSSRWQEIRDANKDRLGGGIDLKVGQELTIPE